MNAEATEDEFINDPSSILRRSLQEGPITIRNCNGEDVGMVYIPTKSLRADVDD